MKKDGFSVVELLVIIVVITLLSTLVSVMIRSWRTDMAETEVRNELTNAANSLEDYRNFNSTYPTTNAIFLNIHNKSENVNLTYRRNSINDTYCLNASSAARSGINWYIDNSNADQGSTPRSGSC